MMIFCTVGTSIFAFPVRQILQIFQSDNVIIITRHTGNFFEEITELAKNYNDVGTCKITYDSADKAEKQMRNFFLACLQNKQAFFF